MITLSILSHLLWLISLAGPGAVEGDPERVIVREMFRGKTVCGSQGELLRGATVAVFKFRRETLGQPGNPEIDYATDPDFWDRMQAANINAVRVAFFDPWQRSHGDSAVDPFRPFPFASLSPDDAMLQGASNADEALTISQNDRRDLVKDLDTIVELASERNMYVMINYHDTAGYRDPDFSAGLAAGENHFQYTNNRRYLYQFWNIVAGRYADRTHVFYELMNEPVLAHPNDYSDYDQFLIHTLYQRVRAKAPETHLVLGSFMTPHSFNEKTMLYFATQLDQLGVDFSNASIGFHPYDISDLPHELYTIGDLMRRYPAINTEQGLPDSMNVDPNAPPAPGFRRHLLGSQSMERMNISWFAWNTFEQEGLANVFEDIFQADAVRKNYYWDMELHLAEGLRRLETVDPMSYSLAKQLFYLYTDGPEPPDK